MEESKLRQGAVIFAKDVGRVAAFYGRALGLELAEEEDSHCLLRGTSTELVIHSLPQDIAEGIEIRSPPRVRGETPIKLVFVVDDLEVVRAAAEATGGGLKPRSEAWAFRGASVLDGWDPEGNVVQFKQAEV